MENEAIEKQLHYVNPNQYPGDGGFLWPPILFNPRETEHLGFLPTHAVACHTPQGHRI